MQDNRQVATTAAGLAVVATLCRILSLGKEALVAVIFGAGLVTDAYALLMLVPALGMALFVSAVRRSFLTQYPQHASAGQADGVRFANRFLASLLITSCGAAVLAWLAVRLAAFGGQAGADDRLAALLRALAAPAALLIVAVAAVSGLTAVLNARNRFALPQATAAVPTLTILCVLAIWGRDAGAAGLIHGLLVGTGIQTLLLLGLAHRAGHRFRAESLVRDPGLRRLWMIALPLIVLDSVTQTNVFVDRAMASMLESGQIAVLTWSGMLKDFLAGTLVASLLTVLLPYFSGQVARGELNELRRSCTLVIRHGAILMFPISALLAIVCPPLFRYFDIGRMEPEDLATMALCLVAYGLGLFADLASTALYQALLALGRIRILLLLGFVANLVPNLVFNLILIRPLGAVGLALSTSLVGYTTLLANYAVLHRVVGTTEGGRTLRVVFGSLTASLAMVACGVGLLRWAEPLRAAYAGMDLVVVPLVGILTLALYALLVLGYPGSQDARRAAELVAEQVKKRIGRQAGKREGEGEGE